MSTNTKLKELALIILKHTNSIDQYLVSEGIPEPSFDHDAPIETPLPPHLGQLRESLLNSIEDLHAHIAGPLPYLMRLISPTVSITLQSRIQEFNC